MTTNPDNGDTTRKIEYKGVHNGEPLHVTLILSEATNLMGMMRGVLTRNALQWVQANVLAGVEFDQAGDVQGDQAGDEVLLADEIETFAPRLSGVQIEAMTLLARVSYPDMIACVVKARGLDVFNLTVEQFAALPDELTTAWEIVTYQLNSHWLRSGGETVAEKKD